MPIWPIHPKPKEGELLSSWITRLARASHLSTTEFSNIVLPDKRTTVKEIDRTFDAEMFKVLSDGTGVPVEQVWETSLLSQEGYVFNYRPYGTTEWISPTAAIEGIKGNGMAYCPQCLESDAEPYYRKDWRFVFNPVCPTHRAFLRHGCPNCSKPYNFFNAISIQPSMANPITTCRWCDADLRRHIPARQDNSALIDQLLSIQAKINAGIASDSFGVPGCDYVHAQPYLKVVHAFMNSLTVKARAKWVARNHLEDIPKGLDFDALGRSGHTSAIEQRTTEEIGILLCLAVALMKDWPNRFLRYTSKNEITQHSFFSSRIIPYWVTQTAEEFFLTTKSVGFDKDEIEAARQMLRKKLGRPESGTELKIYMTQGKVLNMERLSRRERQRIELSPEYFELKHSGPGQDAPRSRSDKWRKVMNISAEQLARIAVLRMMPGSEQAQEPPCTQPDFFGWESPGDSALQGLAGVRRQASPIAIGLRAESYFDTEERIRAQAAKDERERPRGLYGTIQIDPIWEIFEDDIPGDGRKNLDSLQDWIRSKSRKPSQ